MMPCSNILTWLRNYPVKANKTNFRVFDKSFRHIALIIPGTFR